MGLVTGLSTITGCRNLEKKPILASIEGTLPVKLIRTLPPSWKYETIDIKSISSPFRDLIKQQASVIAINDGWISSLPNQLIAPFPPIPIASTFDNQAKFFIDSFGQEYSNRILPIGVSPWVMLFRNGENWFKEAMLNWDVLLNSNLKGSIVLPNSPRLVMSLAKNMSDPFAFDKLRSNCTIYDDRNALNWLLAGKVKVAVLPLVRCWKSLISDPRLRAILPETGSPLSWTVLVRTRNDFQVPILIDWLEKSWNEPLVQYLLSKGWVPPLEHSKLEKYKNYIGDKYGSILIPSNSIWNKCWSLPPLDEREKINLEKLWLNLD